MQRNLGRHLDITSYRFDELSRHSAGLLAHVSSANTCPRLQHIFSELLKRLQDNLYFDHLGLGMFDLDRDVLSLCVQAGEQVFASEIPSDSLGLVLKGGAIEVADVETEICSGDFLERAKSGGFRSFRIVPLNNGGCAVGALAVMRKQPGPFSPEDVRYLDNTAQIVVLLLENALMADSLQREKASLETLLDVNRSLAYSLDLEKLLQGIGSSVRRIVPHDYTHTALYDKASDTIKLYVVDADGQPASILPEKIFPLPDAPAGLALSNGTPMMFNTSDLRAIDSSYSRRLLELGIQSLACFPLMSRGRKLGTLGLSSTGNGSHFRDAFPLLTQVASQLAIALDNARAYDEISKLKDRLATEKVYLEDELRSEHNFGEVVGNSPALKQVLENVEIVSPSDATVLVLGETGTGKELIARAVHRLSSRRDGNFIKLNCAAIPTGLLESELFGHEKGAFTGAVSQKIGRLELADKGTLFLDEIGEIPMELQPKLLRVLQDQEFERLGGNRTIHVDVRLVAATNRDLAQAVEAKQFRSDLFYRLNVFPIHVPPLRERRGDIPMLVSYFVQKFSRRMGKHIGTVSAELIREFEQWHWPGNIRELENFIERSVILTQGKVFFAPTSELRLTSAGSGSKPFSTLEDVERDYILRTLRESGGVIAGARGAAARLGMKRTTLQSRMQKLGIVREEYQARDSA